MQSHVTLPQNNGFTMANQMTKAALQSKSKEELIDLLQTSEKENTRLTNIITKKMSENVLLAEQLSKINAKKTPKIKFNADWNWVRKIEFILQKENRPLTSAEMIEMLSELDDNLKYANNPQKYFSMHLSKTVKYGIVKKERTIGKIAAKYSLNYD